MNGLDITQGDPKIVMSADGASIVVKGGQPVMDGGYENEVAIRLFTLPGWNGNAFLEKRYRIESQFEAAHRAPITRTSLFDIQEAAKADLKPMVDAGIFSAVTATTTNPRGNTVRTLIQGQLPTGGQLKISVEKNTQNWVYQILRPASERV